MYRNMGYWLKKDMTPVNLAYDAMRAINLFAGVVADACIDGRLRFTEGRDVSSGDVTPEVIESKESVVNG